MLIEDNHIHILGAGAVGLFWANRFVDHHFKVELLLKPQKIRPYNLEIMMESSKSTKIVVFPSIPSDQLKNKIKILVVSTKAHQVITALKPLRDQINSKTTIILLQNGMGMADDLLTKFPHIRKSQLFLGINSFGVFRKKSDHIVFKNQGSCWLGHYSTSKDPVQTKLPASIESFLENNLFSGFDNHIQIRQWQKLIVNAVINPLTAILQCRNGELLLPKYQKLIHEIIQECCQIASANQVPVNFAEMLSLFNQVCRNTKSNRSSMAQDLLAGRETEIDYINGYLLKASQHKQLSTVYNQSLTGIIKSIS